MFNSLSDLKPKANRLLSFITNWQLAKPSINQELAKAIIETASKKSLPAPIKTFFKLSQFQQLLANMQEGYLYKGPEIQKETGEEVEFHPPIEIQNIQILAEAFHQLVHLDYNRKSVKDGVVAAKVLGQNILSHLSCIDLFFDYEGKAVNTILDYLFDSIRYFAKTMEKTILSEPHLFTTSLVHLIQEQDFGRLKNLERANYQPDSLQGCLPVLVELQIDAKIEQGIKTITSIANGNAHRLLNQAQSLLGDTRLFYQRNLPLYRPFDSKAQVLTHFSSLKKGEKLVGQKVNEMFYTQFWQEKYAIIQAKQLGTNKKYQFFASQFQLNRSSLDELVRLHQTFLPQAFSAYYLNTFTKIDLGERIFGKPNVHAVQMVLGFYNSQYDFLAELLCTGKTPDLPTTIPESVYALVPSFISLLENYYYMSPKPSFSAIKHRLENLFQGEEALKEFTVKEIMTRIEGTFDLLLPKQNGDITSIEAAIYKIGCDLRALQKELPTQSIEYQLLDDRIRTLGSLDLPSYPDGWHIFGELLGIFFILLHKSDPTLSDKFQQFDLFRKKYPFFDMLFYNI